MARDKNINSFIAKAYRSSFYFMKKITVNKKYKNHLLILDARDTNINSFIAKVYTKLAIYVGKDYFTCITFLVFIVWSTIHAAGN